MSKIKTVPLIHATNADDAISASVRIDNFNGVARGVDKDFIKMLAGYGLTTAEILYRMPDHRDFLQTYIWQAYDEAPVFPALRKFLDYWHTNLDGPLHSVSVAHSALIKPAELKFTGAEFRLQ